MIPFTKEFIESIPKTINDNGCWIPTELTPWSTGYNYIKRNQKAYGLHRIVMCLYYDIDYDDHSIETRHSTRCSRACFFHEHLKPGSAKDNIQDSVRDKTQRNSRKENCPRCGSGFYFKHYRSGPKRGKTQRYCPVCALRNKKLNLIRKEGIK